MAITRPAPISFALAIANCPTGPAAENRHDVPGMNVGDVRAEISRRENIGKQDRLFIGHIVRNFDQADVGVGHAGVLGLQALEGPGIFGPPKNAVPARCPGGWRYRTARSSRTGNRSSSRSR